MSDISTGGCLCGAVRFTCTVPEGAIQACHCVQCQKWTGGGPLMSVRIADLALEGEDSISTYRASEWGERAFCTACGSTLYWRMQGKPVKFLAVGLFDNQTELTVQEEIFIDHRPGWLPPWERARQSTEADEMAQLTTYLKGATT